MSLFSFSLAGENATSADYEGTAPPICKMTFTDLHTTMDQDTRPRSSEEKNEMSHTIGDPLDSCGFGYGRSYANAEMEETAEEMPCRYFFEMQRNLLDDADTENDEPESMIIGGHRSANSVGFCGFTEVVGAGKSELHKRTGNLTFDPFAASIDASPLPDEKSFVENSWLNPGTRTPLSSSESAVYFSSGSISSASPPISSQLGARLHTRRNVYVSELPSHWNTEKLRSACSAFGNIISAKVMHDNNTNESRGYGFVMFETDEQAALCVRSLNSCKMDGRLLSCRFAHEKAMPSFAHSDRIPWHECTLSGPSLAPPSSAGKSSDTPISSEQQPGDSLFNLELLKGTHVACFGDRSRPAPQRSHNVFIQGLPLQWNTDKLRSLCGTFGKVELAKVVRDATTSLSCGHGFVLFEREEGAALCVERLNNTSIEGRTLVCRFARERRGLGDGTPASPPASVRAARSDPKRAGTPLLVRIVDGSDTPSVSLQSTIANNNWSAVAVQPSCHAAVYPHSPLLVAGGVSPMLGLQPVMTPVPYAGAVADVAAESFGVQSFGCNVAGVPYLIAVPYQQARIVSGFSNGEVGAFAALP